MQHFKALVASKGDSGQSLAWRELGEGDLMEGDVLLRVSHSTVNYKDGLAITGNRRGQNIFAFFNFLHGEIVVTSRQRRA